MEILVVALAALATLLIPLVILLAEGAVLAVSGAVELVALGREAWATGSLDAARESRQAKRQPSAMVARWTKWIVYLSAGLAAVTIVVMLALNFLFFDWFVRRALAAAETQNGIAVSFAQTDGNLFVGRVHLTDAKLVRTGHDVSDFDLTVADVSVDADITQLLTGRFAFEDVKVTGVRGELIHTGRRDPNLPRRQFTIERLAVNNVEIEVTDRTHPPREVAVPLTITSLEVADFRSWWAAFDVLFRSTCQGLIDSQPFTILHRPAADGELQETQWIARDLPVYLLGGFTKGPLAWLVDGRLDVDVTTRWQPDDKDSELDMQCHVEAHGFTADVPEQFKVLQKIVEPTLNTLNQTNTRLPLEFNVTMSKEAFRGQLSPLAAGLSEVFVQASAQSLPVLLPNAAEQISETVDRVRSRIQELRRARQERRAAREADEEAEELDREEQTDEI
jgi:hypothetical protein